ncbi:cytochrome P450 [Dentipellis sp. KUC8613]|nr:cytochrome P450 [Dentipellis sp. KUC8613]
MPAARNNFVMDTHTLLNVLVVFVVGAALRAYFVSNKRRHGPLPPGPPRRWFSGNAYDLPRAEPWRTYASWARIYGPIFSLRLFSKPVIILNSATAVLDLLDARSQQYSDRPGNYFAKELCGRKNTVFGLSSQHPRFRRYRRLMHEGLNPRATKSYASIVEGENRLLLRGLRDRPDEFIKAVRRNAGGVILKVAYGWTVESNDDYFVRLVQQAFLLGREASLPGSWAVDTYPWLRFIPEWCPGASFRRRAKSLSYALSLTDRIPFEWAQEQMAAGTNVESFTSRLLRPDDGHEVDPDEVDIVKWCSAALYVGGADTTVSAMTTFFLVMALHPDVQARAQAELDAVIGTSRLFTIEDADASRLPYIAAMIKEILRWGTVVPLGLSHRVTQDDNYAGYFIPEGATITPNIWAITHDPEIYPNPDQFQPDRFLGDNASAQPDPRKFAFGFGRRVCPGAHFAETSLLLAVASILSLFTISKGKDEQGRIIEPEIEWSTGVVSHLKPFECTITPRPGSAIALSDTED